MKKVFLFSMLLAANLSATAQLTDVEVKTGNFSPDWNSLSGWTCPDWFMDAKFGIWAHWGPQCHAEAGDWYARFMYYKGSGAYNWHVEHFGNPAEFGLKELCNDWKAQNWDPEKLITLYKSVGARYFMTLGNHHDNFDLWNSPYQEWNSVNMGPKKDIVKGWSEACEKAGLPLGVSIHASHAWTWLEPSQQFDGNLTEADGKGTWWEGYDPQELYAQNHEHSTGWANSGTIHSQWDWGNGANLPSEAYKQKFQNRVLELINNYSPDMIYFDDTAMPFYGCDDNIGKNILAHYYNTSAALNDGTPQVVVTGKQLDTDQKKYMMWDVERGIPDRMQEKYWQTCTCIGEWHYNQSVYNNSSYKSGATVVRMLVDIVSKNGNLLLSVPIKSDGTIDEKEEAILADIKAWMDINAESIYGTRTWKTFGEGPLAEASNPMNAQGFNEGQSYSSKDVRYVQKDGTIYATIMAWPGTETFSFGSFSVASEYYSGKVTSVKLLGHGDVEYTQGIEGLTVTLPSTRPNEIAPVFAITVNEAEQSAYDKLQELITSIDAYAKKLRNEANYINTGKPSTLALPSLQDAVEKAQEVTADTDEATIEQAITELLAAYNDFKTNGTNPGGLFNGTYESDLTLEHLIEASAFTRTEDTGTRFGAPHYWTVENFNIPNGSDGTKAGLDNYSGQEALMLGVWNDAGNNTTGDLSAARIYRKITLPAGTYYFGAGYNTRYGIGAEAYMFVSTELCSTSDIPQTSIAYYPIASVTEDRQLCGLWFRIEEEQELYIGFQADLANGSSTQEFRAEKVALYKLSDVNEHTLEDFLFEMDSYLSELEPYVSENTGYYSQKAWQAMYDLCYEWMEKINTLTAEETVSAYYVVEEEWKNFLATGKNVGGAPANVTYEDLTEEVLIEASNFTRTEETNDGDRFGAPQYWTVENFGFGDQAGIDNITGTNCLHLEVWYNNGQFQEYGYDISNVRLYRQATLAAGTYYFGASYPSAEANEELYIFAATELLATSEISTRSIAYEKVNQASGDGTFRGITFTLEEETQLYLGFQADFTNAWAHNLRASGVKLLKYNDVSAEDLTAKINELENLMAAVKVNANTGHYAQEAYEAFISVLEQAKQTDLSDAAAIATAYDDLCNAYNDFITNGRNKGGLFVETDATDITEEHLIEAYSFSRTDPTCTDRFASPFYWTVENFDIPSETEGIRGGLDKYPGKDHLTLGVWNDKQYAPLTSYLPNARLYRKVSLPAGSYFFGGLYNTIYNLGEAYIFAATDTLHTGDIPLQSTAYMSIKESSDADGNYWGIYFTLDQPQELLLGWQADLLNSPSTQEFRVEKVKLARYGDATGIEMLPATDTHADAPVEIYTLQGVKVQTISAPGLYIIRKAGKVTKFYHR